MKLNEALDKFIDHLEKKDRSPSTIIAYKKDIEQLFDHYSNENPLVTDYGTKHLEIYIEKLIQDKKFTLKTISRKINSYKTLFKFLHKEKVISVDIASPISHPTFNPKEPRILTTFEYKALRDTARSNSRLFAIIELLLQTGIRIGELSRLKLENINLEGELASAYIEAFSSNQARTLSLNKQAVDALKSYLAERPVPQKDQNFVFITKTGKQVLVRNIRTMVNNTFKKSGIEHVTVNDIRNTFIVYQLEHGMPLERVAEIVGHQRLTSTEKYLNIVKNKVNPSSSRIIPL